MLGIKSNTISNATKNNTAFCRLSKLKSTSAKDSSVSPRNKDTSIRNIILPNRQNTNIHSKLNGIVKQVYVR